MPSLKLKEAVEWAMSTGNFRNNKPRKYFHNVFIANRITQCLRCYRGKFCRDVTIIDWRCGSRYTYLHFFEEIKETVSQISRFFYSNKIKRRVLESKINATVWDRYLPSNNYYELKDWFYRQFMPDIPNYYCNIRYNKTRYKFT